MPNVSKQFPAKAVPPAKDETLSRLPHERDESHDSQESGGPREDIQQAADDLANGQMDTDLRGMRGIDHAVGNQHRHGVQQQTERDVPAGQERDKRD